MSQPHPIDHWWVAARGAPPASTAEIRAFRVCVRASEMLEKDPELGFVDALELADARAGNDWNRDERLMRELVAFARSTPLARSPR